MSPMSKEILSPSKGFTHGLAGKLLEMLVHGFLKSRVFRRAETQELDAFVKSQGMALRQKILLALEQQFELFSHRLIISVSYVPGAIAQAIEANHFDSKYLDLSPDQIPLIGSGSVEHEVHEVHFDRVMFNRDLLLPDALGSGMQFADPLTALHYALKLPNRQRYYPLFVLFEVGGQLWCLCLHGAASERWLRVDRLGLNGNWLPGCRFLAVRKDDSRQLKS